MRVGKSTAFDLIGPVMVGPSSSHTAGAVRLGQFARKILGASPKAGRIILHGSFAETGKGHGTQLALAAGLMGMSTDDERISRAISLAREQGMKLIFSEANLGDVHPNTVRFELMGEGDIRVTVTGSSIGGGRILISEINDFKVELAGDYPTIITLHRDLPGVIAQVTGCLAGAKINIARMWVAREKKGAEALMVVETDHAASPELLKTLNELDNIIKVMSVEPLE